MDVHLRAILEDTNNGIHNVQTHGAIGNGSADDTAAIVAAISGASAGDTIYFPPGTYKITSQIEITKNIALVGAGHSSVLSLSSAPTNPIYIHGTVAGSPISILGDVAADQPCLVFANDAAVASIVAGDWIRIYSTDEYHNGAIDTTATKGEIQKVLSKSSSAKVFTHGGITGDMDAVDSAITGKTSGATGTMYYCTSSYIVIESIAGTFQSGEQVYETDGVNYVTTSDAGNDRGVITCEQMLYDSYDDTTYNPLIDELSTMLTYVYIGNLKITGSTDGSGGHGLVKVEKAKSVLVDNVIIQDVTDAVVGLTFTDVIDGTVRDSAFEDFDTAPGYGVQLTGAARQCTVRGCYFHECRHGISLAGNDGVQRGINIDGNEHVRRTGDNISYVGMVGVHNTADGVNVRNNITYGDGLGYSKSKNVSFRGNESQNAMADQPLIYVLIEATNTIIANNRLVRTGNYPAITVRAADTTITGNWISATYNYGAVSVGYDASHCNISGNRIIATGAGHQCIRIGTGGATADVTDIVIANNVLTSANDGVELDPGAVGCDLTHVNIAGNVINAAGRGVDVRYDESDIVSDLNIHGNTISGGVYGVHLDNVVDAAVSNNLLESVTNGIVFDECSDFIVSYNKIKSATTGINVHADSSDYSMIGNKFNSCTTDIVDNKADGMSRNNYNGTSVIATLSAHATFTMADGDAFSLDTDGSPYNYNPTGDFTAGYSVTICNADGVHNIVFDSAGLNSTISPDTCAGFMYNGTAWKSKY